MMEESEVCVSEACGFGAAVTEKSEACGFEVAVTEKSEACGFGVVAVTEE